MEENKPLDIDAISKAMKKELSLFDNPFSDAIDYPRLETEDDIYTPILQSKEGQYIAENYKPIGIDDYDMPLYPDDATEFMAAIVQTLSREEQKQLARALYHSPLSWRIPINNEGHPYNEKPQEKQLSISTLIKHYSKGIKGKKAHARSQLRKRFEYQSFSDQLKIMRLLLTGTKTDRRWCYRTMMHWWDDALTADLEQAWIDHKDTLCVKTAARRLPESFIKAHQEDMGKLDYKSVCRRLAHDERFVIDKKQLLPMDFCYVIAHNHRHISDQEADRLLFGQTKRILEREQMPREFKTHFGYIVRDRMEDRVRYLPSLLYYSSVGYMIWTLGQTGNTSTIIKFHRWHKMLQDHMSEYLAEEMNPDDMMVFMNRDFRKYQKWNWKIFTRHALLSISDFVTDEDSEFAPEREPLFRPYDDDFPYESGSRTIPFGNNPLEIDLTSEYPSFNDWPF